MRTDTNELREPVSRALKGLAALVPTALGTGRDFHGGEIPDRENVIVEGLRDLEDAGRHAAQLRERIEGGGR